MTVGRESPTARFEVVEPTSPEARRAIGRYFAELDDRFANGFDPADGGADADAEAMSPPNGAFVAILGDDAVIGCGGVQCLDADTVEVKRMWIDRRWRGRGLGRRLLDRLEVEGARLGRTRVVLDTNESLTEAVALYERAGYRPIERYNENPYAHHWFAKWLGGEP